MSLPMVRGLRDLGMASRKFLIFSTFNVISWQCLVGPVLVLFARQLGMPLSWVGVLLSFIPLSMLLVAFTVPLVQRFGPRRLMMTTWTIRNLMGGIVFLMPWTIARYGNEAAWYLLMAATLGFTLMRAAGVGGWFPWIHEVVPCGLRGMYFSMEATLVQIVNIAIAVVVAFTLSSNPTIPRFLCLYTAGILAGMASVVFMSRVPGGNCAPLRPRRMNSVTTYRLALRDKPFIRYTVQISISAATMAWLDSCTVVYMRDILHFSAQRIMILTAIGSLAVALTVRQWGRYADRKGSAKALSLALMGYSIIAFGWLALVPSWRWTPFLVAPLFMGFMLFGGAFWAPANRGMLTLLKNPGRIGHSNIWIMFTALSMGIMPILVGQVIGRWQLAGFRACFLVSGIAGTVCAIANRRIPGEAVAPPLHWSVMLRPSYSFRTLGRIVWITVGMDEKEGKV